MSGDSLYPKTAFDFCTYPGSRSGVYVFSPLPNVGLITADCSTPPSSSMIRRAERPTILWDRLGKSIDSVDLIAPVKSGPICTEGAGCTANRELLDFQSVLIDLDGRSNVTWTRSIDNVKDTEMRFARQM